jgi:hypothetical protein
MERYLVIGEFIGFNSMTVEILPQHYFSTVTAANGPIEARDEARHWLASKILSIHGREAVVNDCECFESKLPAEISDDDINQLMSNIKICDSPWLFWDNIRKYISDEVLGMLASRQSDKDSLALLARSELEDRGGKGYAKT